MQRYKDFKPSAVDSKSNYIGDSLDEQQDWFVVPTMRTRDSNPLAESNFSAALKMLGGEGDRVEVHPFNHWACGWYEIILVAPDTAEFSIAQGIELSLEDYPVLDEEDFSKRKSEEQQKTYTNCYRSDFIGSLEDSFDRDLAAVDVKIDKFFKEMRKRAGICWVSDSGGSSIDMEGILAEVTKADIEALLT